VGGAGPRMVYGRSIMISSRRIQSPTTGSSPFARKLYVRTNRILLFLAVTQTPNLMNSARLHKVFQNFVVPWKIHIYKNLILSSDASRRDASNGIRVAYVNFYNMWVKNMVKD